MECQSWEHTVPAAITGDALWKVQAYRLALYAADIAWRDVSMRKPWPNAWRCRHRSSASC